MELFGISQHDQWIMIGIFFGCAFLANAMYFASKAPILSVGTSLLLAIFFNYLYYQSITKDLEKEVSSQQVFVEVIEQ